MKLPHSGGRQGHLHTSISQVRTNVAAYLIISKNLNGNSIKKGPASAEPCTRGGT